ncbi:hypothetical protein H8N03_05655 [Ramlibacter sp. USB13]|uniref:Uncharacterized protein n=1 Tax=Ramlibacter cellulosilyticus TaxID=2764187 RepID=A0A923MQN0_9BURK|nr:hypothetical protein [Ramlibacter cellulosilyticus]MBC5782419.1 hypothetical protein [Ramlibacter cellulosilyticus]
MSEGAPALPDKRFEGREEFRQLVRDALAEAARAGWREIILSDASFEDWPLGERAVAESLQAWSATGRHLVLLAKRYDVVTRQHARFVRWRGAWSHIVSASACPAADPLDLPSAIWSPQWVLERRDALRSNGFCGSEPERRVALRESLDAWLQKSTPAFPATTLGL